MLCRRCQGRSYDNVTANSICNNWPYVFIGVCAACASIRAFSSFGFYTGRDRIMGRSHNIEILSNYSFVGVPERHVEYLVNEVI